MGCHKIWNKPALKMIHEKRMEIKGEEEGFSNNKVVEYLADAMVREYESDEDIISDYKLFAAAAADTSGIAFALSLVLLGMSPDIQEKVYQEAIDVIGYDGVVNSDNLSSLTYTEMVLMETLRLFPPAPIISRTTKAEIDLGGTILPPNTEILLGIMSMQRCEKVWKDPLEFNPERFSPENAAQRQPFDHIPFSGGPRNCIAHLIENSEFHIANVGSRFLIYPKWMDKILLSTQSQSFGHQTSYESRVYFALSECLLKKAARYSMMILKTALSKVIRSFKVSTNFRKFEDIKVESYMTISMPQFCCTFVPRE
ncbi:hypothetical protein JTB14_016457 [Gonioctena quinquepunctata]|nr:hypothetical protein JTB14_016457 [Gonioctena quinquepunctata]